MCLSYSYCLFLPFSALVDTLGAVSVAGTDGEAADLVSSATRPSLSFLLAASFALKLDCLDFRAWISFQASDILKSACRRYNRIGKKGASRHKEMQNSIFSTFFFRGLPCLKGSLLKLI